MQKLPGPACTLLPGKCVPGEEGAPTGAGLKGGGRPPSPRRRRGASPPPHGMLSRALASGRGKTEVEMEDELAPEVAEGMGE